MEGIGGRFYQETKYAPLEPPDYKPVYQEPPATVPLPEPAPRGDARLAELLNSRRSRRAFTGDAITLPELSWLLWAGDGVSGDAPGSSLRTAPSAGARHPIDTYIVVNRVQGLERGVYRHGVEGHYLERVRLGDYEEAAIAAAAGQEWLRGSCVVFIYVAEFARTTMRYKERGYRYVFLDAGHICQNLYLACEALRIGATAIAALIDDEANALVGADGVERSVVYMAGVGRV